MYVVTRTDVRSCRELIPFSRETLKGKHPDGIFERGEYWILTGEVKKVQRQGGCLHLTVSAVGKGDSSISVDVPAESPCFDKAELLQAGTRITVLMSDDLPVELRLGPYFGKTTWIFRAVNSNAATEVVVSS